MTRRKSKTDSEDGVGAILEDVRRGFRDAEGVRDVLAKYGYNV